MGAPFLPLYGEDLGSAIETIEKIIDKIKTNKFDKEDLAELDEAIDDLKSVIYKDED